MARQANYIVRKAEKYEGLISIPTYINDRSVNSPNYFVISGVPEELNAGKTPIKITANLSTLELGSEVAVEVLDQNNNSIYTEVNDYVDKTRRRIISIYVYPDTPGGLARITFIGVAKNYYTPQGVLTPIPLQWRNKYNVKWTRFLYVDPTKRNGSEIVFNELPYILLRETYKRSILTSLVPGESLYEDGGSSKLRYTNTSATPFRSIVSDPRTGGTRTPSIEYPTPIKPTLPGGYDPGTLVIYPSEDVDPDIVSNPPSATDPPIYSKYAKPSLPTDELIYADETTTRYSTPTTVLTPTTTTRTTFRKPYRTVDDGEGITSFGGTVFTKELSPILKIASGDFKFTKEMVGGFVEVPDPQNAKPKPDSTRNQTFKTESDLPYYGVIKEVLSDTSVALENPYQRLVTGRRDIESTLQYSSFDPSNFFVSYSSEPAYSQSEAYESHVYVEMGNLKPITGDIYKIKAYTKSHSDPHTFTYIGEHILESSNLFIDTGSITTTHGIGIFDTQSTLNFWTSESINSAPQVQLYTSSIHVMEGLHISSSENTTSDGYVDITTTTYKNRYFGDVGYQLSLNIFGETRNQKAELDIILSGSAVLGGGELKIGEIKIPAGGQRNYVGLTFPFKSNLHGFGKPILRVKSGNWHVGNIKIQPIHTIGFAPEHTIFTMPIAPRWDQDILDFKFEFYNYQGEMCETFMTYANANFQHGPAFYIQGQDNLVTGSLYIGNVIGEGIEAAGANSAYIRNIGYHGFTSGSQGNYGFMMWSGSVLPGEPWDAYDGVGLELIGASGSLRFRTEPSLFEVIADQFFVGSYNTQYISGSGGSLEISSSDFYLGPNGDVWIGGDAVIEASLTVDQLFAPDSPPNHLAAIWSDGRAEFTSASIGGWQVNESEIFTDNLLLSSSGLIQTLDFQDSALGPGKGFKMDQEGYAFFENASIRGTLKTTVFEKDTVSAVGGQVIISNATTIKNGTPEIYATDSTIPVENSGGFQIDEFLVAKATSSTGFATEHMKITGVSAGSLTVTRGTSGNTIPTMSAGQVLVSLGSASDEGVEGTGYIHMNASPTDPYTPYIDLYERTGSNEYSDVGLKVRLGDLGELAGTGIVPSNPGYGLYSDNVYLKGGISASFGRFGVEPYYMNFDGDTGTLTIDTPNFSIDSDGDVIATDLTLSGTAYADNIVWSNITIHSGNWDTYISESTTQPGLVLLDLTGANSIIDPTADGATFVRINSLPESDVTGDLVQIAWIKTAKDYQTRANGGIVILEWGGTDTVALYDGGGRYPWGFGVGAGSPQDADYISIDSEDQGWSAKNWPSNVYTMQVGERITLTKSAFSWKPQSTSEYQGFHVDGNFWGDRYLIDDDGSALEPGYSFTNDTDSGIYLDLGNHVMFAYGSSDVFSYNTNRVDIREQVWITGSLGISQTNDLKMGTTWTTQGGQILLASGSRSHPAIGFGSDTNTGIFNSGNGTGIKYATDGIWEFWMQGGGTFHADGNVVSYSSTVPSDFRLKKNIVTISTGSLENIMNLNPVTFNWKNPNRPDLDYGFIAQEIEKVFPEVVKEVDGIFMNRGIPEEEQQQTYKTVQYEKLIPVLTKAIQELKQELDEVKRKMK